MQIGPVDITGTWPHNIVEIPQETIAGNLATPVHIEIVFTGTNARSICLGLEAPHSHEDGFDLDIENLKIPPALRKNYIGMVRPCVAFAQQPKPARLRLCLQYQTITIFETSFTGIDAGRRSVWLPAFSLPDTRIHPQAQMHVVVETLPSDASVDIDGIYLLPIAGFLEYESVGSSFRAGDKVVHDAITDNLHITGSVAMVRKTGTLELKANVAQRLHVLFFAEDGSIDPNGSASIQLTFYPRSTR